MLRILTFIFILSPAITLAQNLVPNSGFEKKSGCPEKPGQITLAYPWFSPNSGTPDYFNTCSPGVDYGTEFNKCGGQIPHSGSGYAGLQFYLLNRNEFFEYIETILDTSLTSGQLYCLTAHVSLGDATYAFKAFGALFSTFEIKSPTLSKMKYPFFKLENGKYLVESDSWICIKGLYRAKGGERFLTIGGFSPRDDFWNIQSRSATDSIFKSTYYFLDDIVVEPVSDSVACRCTNSK